MRFVQLLATAAALQAETATEVNPIRRIVTLLQNMQTEVKAEGEKEQKLYDSFMCYCKQGSGNLGGDIEANAAAIKQLDAGVQANAAQKEQLEAELKQHKADREEAKAAIAQATEIRNKEREEYEKAAGDSNAYLVALKSAISAIKKGMAGTALVQMNFSSLLQKAISSTNAISEGDRQTVTAFLSGPYGDFQASSGEITGILGQMRDQIDKDLGGIVGDEEAAVKNFGDLKAAKTKEVAVASAAIEKKSVRVGELAVKVTQDKNAAANTRKEMSANENFAINLKADCEKKSQEWDTRTKSRNDELLAISQAIKVLNDDDALDIFKKTLPTPGASFLQSIEDSRRSRRTQAYAMIQQAAGASETRSQQLSLLTYLLKVGKVDFSKIIKLIDDMIVHLGNEQKDDDKHRDWCNAEFESSDDKKKDLQRDVNGLSAEIEELNETIDQTKDNIAALQNKIAETDKSVTEATEQRKKENAEFQQTSVELGAASQLLEKAKNRLNKFYNPLAYKAPKQRELTEEERIAQSMGEVIPTDAPQMIAGTNIAVSFLQKSIALTQAAPGAAPATWSGDLKSKGTKSGGVIALMDMMIKDVATQLQEGQHDEKTAQKDYEALMKDSADTRAQDSKSMADDKGELAAAEERKVAATGTRAARADELEETNKYISNLHGNCDFLIGNFAFRKEARSKERDALANAKAVLSGADYQ